MIKLGEWRTAVADAEAAVRLAKGLPPGGDFADARIQAAFNGARIYAQASEFAAGEVTRLGERAVTLYGAYFARALDLLQQASGDAGWRPSRWETGLRDDVAAIVGQNRLIGPITAAAVLASAATVAWKVRARARSGLRHRRATL